MSSTLLTHAPLTVQEIVRRVSFQKQISDKTFWRLKSELGLSPIGARQRPALYPPQTVDAILNHFGLAPLDSEVLPAVVPQVDRRRARLATMAALKAAKQNGRAKR